MTRRNSTRVLEPAFSGQVLDFRTLSGYLEIALNAHKDYGERINAQSISATPRAFRVDRVLQAQRFIPQTSMRTLFKVFLFQIAQISINDGWKQLLKGRYGIKSGFKSLASRLTRQYLFGFIF